LTYKGTCLLKSKDKRPKVVFLGGRSRLDIGYFLDQSGPALRLVPMSALRMVWMAPTSTGVAMRHTADVHIRL